MTGIYLIKNLSNNKVYIGQSIDIKKRIKDHFWKARCKKDISYNSALHSAIRKYGEDNFQCEILEICDMNSLDERERYYINKYNSISPNGYNILAGGQIYRTSLQPRLCDKCNVEIYRYSQSGLCRSCYNKMLCDKRPAKELLLSILKECKGNFREVGRRFGVTDNAVKKWCKSYEIPYHSSDYAYI